MEGKGNASCLGGGMVRLDIGHDLHFASIGRCGRSMVRFETADIKHMQTKARFVTYAVDCTWNAPQCERACTDPAGFRGIEVPRLRLPELGGACGLALRRFDRGPGTGERRGFVSACTAVGSRDGDELRRSCELPAHDLAIVDPEAPGRLLDRTVFDAIVRNTGRHLHNHALLHRNGRWSPSPAFDIAPNPPPSGGARPVRPLPPSAGTTA